MEIEQRGGKHHGRGWEVGVKGMGDGSFRPPCLPPPPSHHRVDDLVCCQGIQFTEYPKFLKSNLVKNNSTGKFKSQAESSYVTSFVISAIF